MKVLSIFYLFLLVNVLSFANAAYQDFGWINEYFETRVLGKYTPSPRPTGFAGNPGPCKTNKPGDICRFEFSKLSSDVRSITLNLGLPGLTNVSLGDALNTGTMDVSYLQISQLNIKSITTPDTPKTSTPTTASFDLDIKQARFSATADFRIAGVKLLGITGGVRGTIVITAADQLDGNNITLSLVFNSPDGLSNQIPTKLTIPVDQCSIQLDLGLKFIESSFVIDAGFLSGNAFATQAAVIIKLITPVISYYACDVISQLGYVSSTQPGLIGKYLDYLATNITKWKNAPDPNILLADTQAYNALSAAKKEKVIDFQDNLAAALVSEAVNDWLGKSSVHALLVINDVVNTITKNTGKFTSSELTAAGLKLNVDAQAALVGIEILDITLEGANTFSKFKLLENKYGGSYKPEDRMHYTLNHEIQLDDIHLVLGVDLRLDDGAWESSVTDAPPEITTFVVDVTISDLYLNASTLTALAPSELKTRQLGQLLGGADATTFSEQVLYSIQCSAPMLYNLILSNLVVSIGSLNPVPVLTGFPDAGYSKLINNSIKSILQVIESAITVNLGDIVQQFVRPKVNSLIQEKVIGKAATCIPFVPKTTTPKFFNFATSNIFKSISTLVNDVIGGNPVLIRESEVNKVLSLLIKGVVDFLKIKYTFDNAGDWTFKPDIELDFGEDADVKGKIEIGNLHLENVNSIYKLLLTPVDEDQFSFDLAIGDGDLKDAYAPTPSPLIRRGPLKIHQTLGVYVVYPPIPNRKKNVGQQFTIDISISQIDISLHDALIKLDMNSLFKLKVTDLIHPSCLLATLKDGQINLLVSVGSVSLGVTRLLQSSDEGSNLDAAITKFAAELANSSNQPMFNAIVDKLLTSTIGIITNGINNHNFNDTTTTVDNCVANSPFSSLIAKAIGGLLSSNITQLIELYSGEQPPVPSFTALDASAKVPTGAKTLIWNKSLLGRIIPKFVDATTSTMYKNFLKSLGEGSGTYVKDSIIEEVDGSITIDADLSSLNMSLNGFVDGGYFIGGRLKITNVDKVDVDSMKLIEPKSQYVTQIYISIPATINIDLSFTLDMPGDFFGRTGRLIQTITLSIDLSKITIDILTLIALNYDAMSKLSIGHFITVDTNQQFTMNKELLNCLLGLFYSVSLPKLLIDIDQIIDVSISTDNNNVLSAGFVGLVNAIIEVVVDIFEKDIPNLTQGALRVFINKIIIEPFLKDPGTCKTPTTPPLTGTNQLLDFKKSNALEGLHYLVDKLKGKTNDYSLINSSLNSILNSFIILSDKIGIKDFPAQYQTQFLGYFTILVGQINLKNWGTIKKLELFNVEDQYKLGTDIEINGPSSLSLVVQAIVKQFYVTGDTEDEIKATVNFEGIKIAFDAELKLNLIDFMAINAGSFSNISQISCVVRAVEDFKLSDVKFNVTKFDSTLECVGVCNSPMAAPLGKGIQVNIDKIISFALKVSEYVVKWLASGAFYDLFKNKSSSADKDCATSLDLGKIEEVLHPPPIAKFDVGAIFGLLFIGIMAGIWFIMFLTAIRHVMNRRRYLEEAMAHYESEPGATAKSVAISMAKEEIYIKSLFQHPNVPWYFKFGVPSAICVNIISLVACIYFLPNFTTDLQVVLAGSKSVEIVLVPFSIRSTINDMWASGAIFIALLIAIASAMWPIAKNWFLLWLWFAPSTVLSKHKKEVYLENLDLLGKWSMIDIYVVVIVIGVMRFYVPLSLRDELTPFLPADAMVFSASATPVSGIILLSIAAICSLAINHVIIYWAERVNYLEKRLFKKLDGIDDAMLGPEPKVKIALKDYIFSTKTPSGHHDQFTEKSKKLMNYFLAGNIVAWIIAMALPCYDLYYHGWVGMIVILIDPIFAARHFNLFSVGSVVTDANKGTAESWIVLIFFELMYYITVVIAPYVQVFLFLVLWNKPMSFFEAKNIFMWANIAGYWASVEIFTVSVLAASTEVGHIGEYMLNVVTGGICGSAHHLVAEVLGEKDGHCLYIELIVGVGAFLGIPIAIYVAFINGVALRACRVALRDREMILEGVHLEDRYAYTKFERKLVGPLFPHSMEHHDIKDHGHGHGGGSSEKIKETKKKQKEDAQSKWVVQQPVQQQQQPHSMMMVPSILIGGGQQNSYQQFDNDNHAGKAPPKSNRFSVEI